MLSNCTEPEHGGQKNTNKLWYMCSQNTNLDVSEIIESNKTNNVSLLDKEFDLLEIEFLSKLNKLGERYLNNSTGIQFSALNNKFEFLVKLC